MQFALPLQRVALEMPATMGRIDLVHLKGIGSDVPWSEWLVFDTALAYVIGKLDAQRALSYYRVIMFDSGRVAPNLP